MASGTRTRQASDQKGTTVACNKCLLRIWWRYHLPGEEKSAAGIGIWVRALAFHVICDNRTVAPARLPKMLGSYPHAGEEGGHVHAHTS